MINSSSDRTGDHDPHKSETRGRKKAISSEKIQEMKDLLETERVAARALTWEQLGMEVGLNLSTHTIKDAMEKERYHKRLACP